MALKISVATLTLFLSIPALAETIPTCTASNLANYNTLESGCMTGPFTFKNFSWNSSEGDSFVRVDATQVNVVPVVTASSVGVNFTSTAFSVPAGQRIAATLDYTIDPPPPILDDFSLDLSTNTPVFPGNAIIQTFICAGGLFSNDCAGGTTRFLQVQHLGSTVGNILSSRVVFPATNIIDVRTTILLDGGPVGAGGSSSITGFTQAAVSTGSTVVPEPASLALGGLGLGLMAWANRRRTR